MATLTGTATPGHLIQIRDATWTIKAATNVNGAGTWAANKVAGLCAPGAKNNVILEEATNGKRVTLATITAAGARMTGNLTAKVATRNPSTGAVSLTGTARPGDLLQIRTGTWGMRARVYADAKGNWTATNVIGLLPAGKAGRIIIEEANNGKRVALITLNIPK